MVDKQTSIQVNETEEDQPSEDANFPVIPEKYLESIPSYKQKELRGEAHSLLLDIFADLDPETSSGDDAEPDPFGPLLQALSVM